MRNNTSIALADDRGEALNYSMAGMLVLSHGCSENAKRALLQGVEVFKQCQVA